MEDKDPHQSRAQVMLNKVTCNSIDTKNIGLIPIINLDATLEHNNRCIFDCKDITKSKPLAPSKSASDTEILIGVGSTKLSYPPNHKRNREQCIV
jgi:hypothetical protein